MAFLVRNTHRTFSAIFKKTVPISATQFSFRASHTGPEYGVNPKLTRTVDVDLNAQQNVEVVKDAPEWKYIERILPIATIPAIAPKADYTSGWTPQTPESLKHPYFVRRTRNHMVPVYLTVDIQRTRKTTTVKNIQGDIWALHNELFEYIEYYMKRRERTRVNEFTNQIKINGDYVNLIKDYLISKGF